jgi:FkbM family methyltransferase
MRTTIAEHSVDFALLPPIARILDLGCRGFAFTNQMKSYGHIVAAVDIDDLDGVYYRCGISDYNGLCGAVKNKDPQATKLSKNGSQIVCMTLERFSKSINIDFWDLIKIDVEGSEYEIIMSLERPPAKQLSIEFHLHTGVYGQAEMALMEGKLKGLGYKAVSHEYTTQHGAGFNYWDSLFILK